MGRGAIRIGTQARPRLTSCPLHPQPMFNGFIAAAIDCAARSHRQPQVV